MSWSGYSPEKEKTFDYYYEKARDDLYYEDMGAWGSGPSKTQIRNRAAQLALNDNSVDYEEYQTQIQSAKRGCFVGAWEADPNEAQLITEARSNLASSKSYDDHEDKKVDEIKFVDETKHLEKNKINLLPSQMQQKISMKLNISVVINRIKECSKKYLTFGIHQSKKYALIQDALIRAVKEFENNQKLNLSELLTTRFAKKPSIKDAFEYGRIFGKSDAFENLCDLLRYDPIEEFSCAPPGGIAFV